MYTVHTSFSGASIRYVRYAVHTTEYSVYTTTYNVLATAWLHIQPTLLALKLTGKLNPAGKVERTSILGVLTYDLAYRLVGCLFRLCQEWCIVANPTGIFTTTSQRLQSMLKWHC